MEIGRSNRNRNSNHTSNNNNNNSNKHTNNNAGAAGRSPRFYGFDSEESYTFSFIVFLYFLYVSFFFI